MKRLLYSPEVEITSEKNIQSNGLGKSAKVVFRSFAPILFFCIRPREKGSRVRIGMRFTENCRLGLGAHGTRG